MSRKKIPLRKCVACNENRPKKELIRVVKNKDGIIQVDLTGKINGRGAYICQNKECFDKVKKNKKLDRALEIEIPDEIYDKLNDVVDSKEEL
ncbi:RNase P modulator RnpM [Schnuerera ultunensis]|uniref:Putative RNA binding protein putative new fold n=1 Tax=[Clostridium] ultunense Esp TaxID=1288971 RepID=A0A1M4PNN3_9FIRM|nr:YlxR family protein [Schnuerera ultunensis]SHD77058.1 putative RNA binding protein; putative new fold [[Clostridium] ultunense Esp]